MSADKKATGGPSLPEEIGSEAGLPRVEDLGHALHDVGERVADNAELLHDSARRAAHEAIDDATEAGHDARERLDETAESVRDRVRASAADARERAHDAYDDVRSWASDRYEHQRARAEQFADRNLRRYRETRNAAEDFVVENPLLVGVVGLAAGLLLGALLPRTRQEDETFGPYADEFRDQGLRYARDVTQQGRAFVERALDPDALDEAVERAGAHGGQGIYEGAERKAHRL